MHLKDWRTQKPGHVSSSLALSGMDFVYIHEHDNDSADHDECGCSPKEHPILAGKSARPRRHARKGLQLRIMLGGGNTRR